MKCNVQASFAPGGGFCGEAACAGYGSGTWKTTIFTFGSGNLYLNFLVHPW